MLLWPRVEEWLRTHLELVLVARCNHKKTYFRCNSPNCRPRSVDASRYSGEERRCVTHIVKHVRDTLDDLSVHLAHSKSPESVGPSNESSIMTKLDHRRH